MEGVSGEGCVCREIRKGRFWAEGCIALGDGAMGEMGFSSASRSSEKRAADQPPIGTEASEIQG